MFIGEGPGADEDAQGLPFVGRSGQLLTKMINAMGLSRQQVYIANIVKCRPPANRDPLMEEAQACIGYLRSQIQIINPEIIEHSGTVTSREGCMSVPDFTGNVTRAERIVVSYFDENMQQNVLETSGFEAILIQHETDHLNGMLFIDRVISKRTDLFRRKKY